MRDVPSGDLKTRVHDLAVTPKKRIANAKIRDKGPWEPISREVFEQLFKKTTACLEAFPPNIELIDEKGPDSPTFFPVKDIIAMLDCRMAMGATKDISGHI